jgi:hypothetical protein
MKKQAVKTSEPKLPKPKTKGKRKGHFHLWVGALKDDPTAEADMNWILAERRRYIKK